VTKNTLTTRAYGYWIAVASAIFLSTTAIFIRHLTQTYHLPALVLAFWRNVFVVLTLVIVFQVLFPDRLRVSRDRLAALALHGLILAFFNALWTLSVTMNGAAVATVLVYSSAAFTSLLGWLLLKERLGWMKLLAIALSIAGCALISGAWDTAVWSSNAAGVFTGILSGLSYAIYTLMGRSAAQRGQNPWTTLLYTFGFAGIFLFLINLEPFLPVPGAATKPTDLFWLGTSFSGWGILLLLAAGPTVMGFGLYNLSLSHLPASVVNLIVSMEPAFTAVTAYLLLGEQLTGIQISGSLMILAGVVLLRLGEGGLASREATSKKQPPMQAES
jgi:drug/metabolite transporter (DMT)-like permease